MRTFILYARKARTSSDFDIQDLPNSGGRMDLVCRCISSALWLSHQMREDSRIYVVLNGPPNPPVTVLFDGSIVKKVSVDEVQTGLWIKKVLSEDFGKDWVSSYNGIKVSRKSFQEIIKEQEGNMYILHEKGKPINSMELKENPVFILGDHIGIPRNDEKFALRYGEKISLGKSVYLASSCISIINWICDSST